MTSLRRAAAVCLPTRAFARCLASTAPSVSGAPIVHDADVAAYLSINRPAVSVRHIPRHDARPPQPVVSPQAASLLLDSVLSGDVDTLTRTLRPLLPTANLPSPDVVRAVRSESPSSSRWRAWLAQHSGAFKSILLALLSDGPVHASILYGVVRCSAAADGLTNDVSLASDVLRPTWLDDLISGVAIKSVDSTLRGVGAPTQPEPGASTPSSSVSDRRKEWTAFATGVRPTLRLWSDELLDAAPGGVLHTGAFSRLMKARLAGVAGAPEAAPAKARFFVDLTLDLLQPYLSCDTVTISSHNRSVVETYVTRRKQQQQGAAQVGEGEAVAAPSGGAAVVAAEPEGVVDAEDKTAGLRSDAVEHNH